jgi:hypothetical protein
MEFETFEQSLKSTIPPATISVYLLAMWYDNKGDWNKAHSLVDSMEDATACWVHAYLHRKEGDQWNADYWYRKADKKRPYISLQQEWESIVKTLC